MTVEPQDRVYGLANSIMAVLAGADAAEAHTALSLSVVAAICAFTPNDPIARHQTAKGFTRQVYDLVQREDIVEWVEASIVRVPRAGHA